jgi:polar amino acid transport system substrate-binding protein
MHASVRGFWQTAYHWAYTCAIFTFFCYAQLLLLPHHPAELSMDTTLSFRWLRIAAFAMSGALLGACAGTHSATVATPAASLVREFAPTGTLRAAINFGNPILANKDATGAPVGVSVDLARELGKRLGLPVELVQFSAAGKVVDAVKAGSVDIAFVAIDPVRGADMGQTAAYIQIEGAYAVRQDSKLTDNAQVDVAGNRIMVARGSAYDLYLSRTIQAATLQYVATSPAVADGMVAQALARHGVHGAAVAPAAAR